MIDAALFLRKDSLHYIFLRKTVCPFYYISQEDSLPILFYSQEDSVPILLYFSGKTVCPSATPRPADPSTAGPGSSPDSTSACSTHMCIFKHNINVIQETTV